jgi:hypothetical protein
MHRTSVLKLALALTAGLAGSLAQAHGPSVQWGMTIGTPVLAVPLPPPPPLPPLPVFRPRQQVVVVPAPILVQRPVQARHHGWRDSDRDGIPNRYDRVDNRRITPWDRDGDGIPNRYDRYDNRYDQRYDNRRDGWHGR